MSSQGSELIKVLYVFENYATENSLDHIGDENRRVIAEIGREQTNYGITISGMELSGKLSFKIM